jgi:hypothetical protein
MYWHLVEGLPVASSEESDGEARDEKTERESAPSVTTPLRRRQHPTPPESPDSKRKPPSEDQP